MTDYRIEKVRNRHSIIVTCPRCGKPGKLWIKAFRFIGRAYRVMHSSTEGCCFGITSEGWEELNKIWEEVRIKRRLY